MVCNPRKNALLKHGNKSDKIDARKLADRLRLNDLKPVYHGETGVRMLRELARSYLTIVKDLSRVMNRLKALYRSWAIPCAGRDVYYTRHREEWLGKIPRGRRPPASRATLSATGHAAALAPASAARTAGGESQAYHHRQATADSVAGADSLRPGGGADPDSASFSHQAPAVGLQRTGVGNPHQRRTLLRQRPTATSKKQISIRGLNKDHNHDLKGLFKGAATRASVQPGPFQDFYQRSLAKGIKPTMVRLTLARKIAAITLTLWKKGENFDAEKLKSQAA